jgi:hypothetical protein
MALSPKACSFRIGQIFTLSAFALGIGAGARSAKAISVPQPDKRDDQLENAWPSP